MKGLNKILLEYWVDHISDVDSILTIVDPQYSKTNPLTASTMIYETFNDLYSCDGSCQSVLNDIKGYDFRDLFTENQLF